MTNSAVKAVKAVTAVERVVNIFQTFETSQRPMSLTDLASAAGIPKSSCHAIVGTLIARGYLYSLSRPRALYPTQRMYDVTRRILSNDPFIERVRPLLLQLRDETGETVILGKRQGDLALYLQVIEGDSAIRYSARSGEQKPLHSSSVGKALLGSMREVDLREFIHGRQFAAITPNTLTDPQDLVESILQSRKRGFYVSQGENVPDVWAVSAGVQLNTESFALAVAGPRNRLEPSVMKYAHLVVQACRLLAQHTRLELDRRFGDVEVHL